jgi:hypothetical protein
MSLNSLQDNMSRRAASMAAMAKRATNPQDIQAIQKSLVDGVQNGSIQPYVGIPLIQELTQRLTEAKTQMAQSMASAGMQQPQGQQGAPIAQQVMQQAAQESQGLEALPSNLPQEYAGGGIIAFEGGGEVERYQVGGGTGDPMGMGGNEIMDYAGTGDPYVGKNLLETLTFAPNDPEWKRKLKLEEALREREKTLGIKPPVAPTPTPAAVPPAAKAPAPLAAPAAPKIPSGSGFKMPTLPTMKETAAPVLTDLDAITKDMPAKTKAASEAAVKASQAELEAMDKPGFEAREARLGKREAAQEKDSAIGRFLNLMSTGFDIAGSSEKTVAGAISKSKGIQNLIQGEAANRAAKDKLEDYRDNLEQQKIAAKKGNYQAAQAAGERAADSLYKYTNLNLNAASAGNTQAIQRQQVEQQGNFQKASLEQSGILGLNELGLKKEQLNQNATIANAQLANNLAVAQIRANRESGITPYQMAQLRVAAEKNVDPGAVRAALAKKFKMSKAPVPGADASFDDKFKIAYENEMASYINRVLGTPGGGGGGGDFGAVDSLVDKYAPKR